VYGGGGPSGDGVYGGGGPSDDGANGGGTPTGGTAPDPAQAEFGFEGG
jgi:hypothetical protein